MRKFYYNFMRISPRTIPLLLGALLAPAIALPQQPPLRTASRESYEGLTISATPWTEPSKYKEKFPKKSPFSAGVLAVQVSFRNDSDDSIKVELARIRLTVNIDAENKQELPSLSPAELAQAVLRPGGKDPSKRQRLPIPVTIPKSGKDKNCDELQKEAQDASVPTAVIAPHTTVQDLS